MSQQDANEIKLLPERAHNSAFLVGKINKLLRKKESSKLAIFVRCNTLLISEKLSKLRLKISNIKFAKTSNFLKFKFKTKKIKKKLLISANNFLNKRVNLSFDFLFQSVHLPDFRKIMNQEIKRADILILCNIIIIIWLATLESVPKAESEESFHSLNAGAFSAEADFNSLAMTAESKIVSPGCDDRTRCDFDAYNYLEKKCDIDKDNKRNSEICGVDQKDSNLDPPKPKTVVRSPVVLKRSCRSDDKPRYSENKGKHVDEDCCPDPDEWPKPGCVYTAADYAIMLKGPIPANKLKKH